MVKGHKPLLAMDTETTGLSLYAGDELFSYSVMYVDSTDGVDGVDGADIGKGNVWRVPKEKRRLPQYKKKLLDICHSHTLVFHNAKFDITAIERFTGKSICRNISFHDTLLMSKLLQNDCGSHELKVLGEKLAGISREDEKEVKRLAKQYGGWKEVPEDAMKRYQMLDVQRTMLLFLLWKDDISEYQDIYNMELELICTTIEEERRGIMLNRKVCEHEISRLHTSVEQIVKSLSKYVGKPVNLNRAKDVQHLLYEKEGLPVLQYTTKKQEPATNKEVLLELRQKYPNPVIEDLLKYRSYSRGRKILQGYLELANEDGIIHPNINTNGAITGRQSCNAPNLQNVQKNASLLVPYPIAARKVFRPRPGYVNLHLDYSGIEMRLLVHYAREEELIDILEKGEDVHLPGTCIFFPEYPTVNKRQKKILRGAAKNANFALCYGAGPSKLASTLGIESEDAASRYFEYRNRFPNLIGLSQTMLRTVMKQGYITTTFGRRLYVDSNKAYMGINYLIQGTAAGIIKRAQNRVAKILHQQLSSEAQILLPIHDEIIIEYPRKQFKKIYRIIKLIQDAMIDFPLFTVPLEIDCSIATYSWDDTKSWDMESVI